MNREARNHPPPSTIAGIAYAGNGNRFRVVLAAACVGVGLSLIGGGGAFAQTNTESQSMTDQVPVLKLTLADAIQAALDKNPNIRLFRERVEAARSVTKTQLGALLPNLSATGKMNNQTFFLGTIGGAPVRTQPFDIVDGRGTFSQSLFS